MDGVGEASRRSRPALRSLAGETLLTYGELNRRADRLASRLGRHGVGPARIVCGTLANGPEFLVALLATWRAGAIFAPVSPRLTDRERGRATDLLRPRVLVTREMQVEPWPGAPPGGPACEAGLAPAARHRLVLSTSGSTGQPKGVLLTCANVDSGIRAVADTCCLAEDDAMLATLPWTHGHGLFACVLAPLLRGAAIVLPRSPGAGELAAALDAGLATCVSTVPTLLAALCDAPVERAARAAGRPLRFIRTASAMLPPAVGRLAEARFGCPVAQAYGMTETSHQAVSNRPVPAERQLETVGVPAGIEVRCSRPVERDEFEIEVRGPSVFDGYLDRADLTARVLSADGWYRTGDIGVVAADGHVHLRGRLTDFINRNGNKVWPSEVECAVLEHDGVAAALAVGVPDPRVGQEIGLLVVRRPGAALSCDDLRRHLDERVAPYKQPGIVRFVAVLPSLPNGKPSRGQAALTLSEAASGCA